MNETDIDSNLEGETGDLGPEAAPSAVAMPLALDMLSPAVKQLLAGASGAKLMAARGIAPLRPIDLAVALYQLGFDAEAAIGEAARKAPTALPESLLKAMLGEALPGPVLHFFGAPLEDHRVELLELVLYNRATPDDTFVKLAKRLPEAMTEIICQNEQRLLRCPDIVASLFANPAARMSSVNRALELCARNGVVVDIPGYQEIVKAIQGDPSATDGSADAVFGAVAQAMIVDDEVDGAGEESKGEVKPEAKKVTGSETVIDFTKLRIFEKVRLATFGNAYCRNNLIRDPNRLVAMAVIKSPKIKDTEIVAASGNRNVHEDVIRYISNQRSLLKKYQVRYNLVNNPKCPMPTAARLLGTLQVADIKKIAGSRNISSALSATAKKIMQRKEG